MGLKENLVGVGSLRPVGGSDVLLWVAGDGAPLPPDPHPRWIIVLVGGRVMQRDVARFGTK